jgi:Peptidase U49
MQETRDLLQRDADAVRAAFRLRTQLLEAADRLDGDTRGLPAGMIAQLEALGEPTNVSFSLALKKILEASPDPSRALHEHLAAALSLPPELADRMTAVHVHTADLASSAIGFVDPPPARAVIIVDSALVQWFETVMRLAFAGLEVDPENRTCTLDKDHLQLDAQHLGELLGSTLEAGIPILHPEARTPPPASAALMSRVYACGLEFLHLHEISHVLLGHHENSTRASVRELGTGFQQAVHSIGAEFIADRTALGLLLRLHRSDAQFAFAGAIAFLRSLAVLERFSDRHTDWRTHPPASERVMRLADQCREIYEAAQVRFNGRGLEAAVRHRLDALVAVLEDQPSLVFSPWIKLFNDIIPDDGVLDEAHHAAFRRRIVSWLGLGSSWLIVEALGFFWADAPTQVSAQTVDIERNFFLAAGELINGLVDYLEGLGAEGRRLAGEVRRVKDRHAQRAHRPERP